MTTDLWLERGHESSRYGPSSYTLQMHSLRCLCLPWSNVDVAKVPSLCHATVRRGLPQMCIGELEPIWSSIT